MLEPAAVDLGALAQALDDRTNGRSWWIDRHSGAIRSLTRGGDPEAPEELAAVGWVRIRRTESRESYRDMADFVASVHRRRAADLLDRAINGPGAFRRFKDTLVEFPDLRDAWFRFRDARGRRRALAWLVNEGLMDPLVADRAAAEHPDPTGDDADLAAAVAVDLSILYGDRLDRVLVVGPWAQSDLPEIPALDLVVVLCAMQSPWAELDRMDELLWRHSVRSGIALTALPVRVGELEQAQTARLRRAAAEAVRIV
ncbi:Uncharacterised protein family (UPF0158) [Pseudonocardia thermophila]|jgi:Uncharacterised protein family (UPF0158).|uniref:Uncharacterized protein family (UPF0158) n=1 Tax=Pseudonocardia thermophila TaxID=1848 RepID=A0A1M6VI63_PSETH|nr:UPF0158 family protein [Pseudonocardia thermophila]SHK81045.1 Uncharacterised protein family (UPF0158) [Pseudonocardia thermophila]